MDVNSKKNRKDRRKRKLQQKEKSPDGEVTLKNLNTFDAAQKVNQDLYSQIFPNDSESEEEEPVGLKVAQGNASLKKNAERENVVGRNKNVNLISGNEKKKRVQEETRGSLPSPKKKKNEEIVPDFGKPNKVGNYVLRRSQSSSDEDSDNDKGFEYDNDSGNDDENDSENEAEEEAAAAADSEPEGEEEESEDSDDSDDKNEFEGHRTVLRKQLKDLSFEELEALKQKMGLKEYNEAMFGAGSKNKRPISGTKGKKRKFERTNKHRPREMSSKIRVPKLREIVKVPKKIRKDPRFDDSCGQFNEEYWNSEYSFLRDMQKKEAEELKKNLKSVDDSDKKNQIKRFIQKVTDKEKAIAVKEKQTQKMKQEKETNKKLIQEGKKPFYVKQSTRKLMDLVEKYDELKASGRLEKYLKKKRKKNAIRDQKSLNPIK